MCLGWLYVISCRRCIYCGLCVHVCWFVLIWCVTFIIVLYIIILFIWVCGLGLLYIYRDAVKNTIIKFSVLVCW